MPLPDFTPPSLNELRALWRTHRGDADIERLILEIHHQRQALLQMRMLITAGIAEVQRDDPLAVDGASPLRTLDTRILHELVRIEEPDTTPKVQIRERS
jgi:hypothetical protein